MKLKPSAVALLRRVARQIVRMPETFNMGDWISHDPFARPSKKRPAPFCGTVACLAGHIVLAGRKRLSVKYDWPWDVEVKAAQRLGLTTEETACLFFMREWPLRFRRSQCPSPKTVAARIHHFISTGK